MEGAIDLNWCVYCEELRWSRLCWISLWNAPQYFGWRNPRCCEWNLIPSRACFASSENTHMCAVPCFLQGFLVWVQLKGVTIDSQSSLCIIVRVPRVNFLKSEGNLSTCLDFRVCKCTHKWDVLGDLLSHEIQIEIQIKYYYLIHELWIEIEIQIKDDSTNQGCVGWNIFQQSKDVNPQGWYFCRMWTLWKGVSNLKPWNLQSSLPRCAKTGSPPGKSHRKWVGIPGTWLRCGNLTSLRPVGLVNFTWQGGVFCWPGLVEPVWLWEKGQRAVWAGAAHFLGRASLVQIRTLRAGFAWSELVPTTQLYAVACFAFAWNDTRSNIQMSWHFSPSRPPLGTITW